MEYVATDHNDSNQLGTSATFTFSIYMQGHRSIKRVDDDIHLYLHLYEVVPLGIVALNMMSLGMISLSMVLLGIILPNDQVRE